MCAGRDASGLVGDVDPSADRGAIMRRAAVVLAAIVMLTCTSAALASREGGPSRPAVSTTRAPVEAATSTPVAVAVEAEPLGVAPTEPPTSNSTAPAIAYDAALWERLHDCEQPGDWYASGYFGNGLHGAGGLGMSDGAWTMGVTAAAARGVSLPGSPLDATIDQQMQGAQAFYDSHGWAWACH